MFNKKIDIYKFLPLTNSTLTQKCKLLTYTLKTVLVKIRNIYLYKVGHHTIRNKGDLESVIKTKTFNLAL